MSVLVSLQSRTKWATSLAVDNVGWIKQKGLQR